MKKIAYIQPVTEMELLETEQFIATSPLTDTSLDDLGVDVENFTDEEGHVRGFTIYDVFNL